MVAWIAVLLLGVVASAMFFAANHRHRAHEGIVPALPGTGVRGSAPGPR